MDSDTSSDCEMFDEFPYLSAPEYEECITDFIIKVDSLTQENKMLHCFVAQQSDVIQKLNMAKEAVMDDLYDQDSFARNQEATIKELIARNQQLVEQMSTLTLAVGALKQTQEYTTKKLNKLSAINKRQAAQLSVARRDLGILLS